MSKRSFGTRLDDHLGQELIAAAAATGLKTADLLRIGARMVLDSIRVNGGLHLGNPPIAPPPGPRRGRPRSLANHK
jgi:hypothetical protein